MSQMTEELSAKLRAPFPDETVGKLPRITCNQCRQTPARVCEKHTKRQCDDCRNYITGAHIHLDYVGHAAVTDRLLRVDPAWTWEPCATTPDGLPLIKDGQLWVRLTVGGVTRLGIGAADGKSGADAVKEMIGDALRNAAMRFGVAIDLWSKEDLHAAAPEPVAEPAAIAALVARMNALPAEARRQCKAMFVDAFGRPDGLRAASEAQASAMIAGFETADSSPHDGGGSVVDDSPVDPEHAPVGGDVAEGFVPPPEVAAPPAEPKDEGDSEPVERPVPAEPSSDGAGVTGAASGAPVPPRQTWPNPAKTPMSANQRAMLHGLLGKAFTAPPEVSGSSDSKAEYLKTVLLEGLLPALGVHGMVSRKQIDRTVGGKVIDALQRIEAGEIQLVAMPDGAQILIDDEGEVWAA